VQHLRSSIPHCGGKNVEQSTTGSDVINNNVIIQIPAENLFILLIISWPLMRYYSDCKVAALLMYYSLERNYM